MGALPEIIQGGMGVHVSGHRLARTVAMAGGLGVVSGTGLDGVYARMLQDGDRGARWAIEQFPDQAIAERCSPGTSGPDGRGGKPYGNLHKWIIDPRTDRQRASLGDLQELAVASAFAEVMRAKHHHDGVVGINVLRKIALPIPATIYGAMLAGVDVVLTGAGSPDEMPRLLDALARHEEGVLSVKVLRAAPGAEYATRFAPARVAGLPTGAPLRRPRFLAIVASVDLAAGLASHPPRAQMDSSWKVPRPEVTTPRRVDRGIRSTDPSYGERDSVDLTAIAAIGLPFWLAGSYGSPEGLRGARDAGARGIQAGTVFALSRESGLTSELKSQVLAKVADRTLSVITDGSASPTGFPFKVHQLEGTLSDSAVRDARERRCDLGYLRQPVFQDGELVYVCPAEPEPTLKSKGGRPQQATGRVCLCNALFASAGLAQRRHDGYLEAPIFTGGDDLDAVRRLSPQGDGYSATAALSLIRGQ